WDMTWEYSTDTYEGWDMSEKQGEATWWSGDHRVVMDHEGNTGYPALSWQEGHGYFEFSQVKNQSAGVQFEITITAYDKNDEKKTDYDGTVNLTDTTGTITPGEANFTGGNWTGGVTITKSQEDVKITAVDQNDVTLIGDSNTFDVTPGATDHVEIKPENSTIMAGGTQTYNATAYDQYGNKEEVTGETNWSDDVVPTNASSWVDNEITVDQKGNWTVIGEYDGVQGTANLTVEQYVEYDLTINIDGEGSTDPGEGTYSYSKGTEVTIQAIEDVDGWSFNEWTGDHTGTSNEINITIDDNKNITANFEIHTYGLFIDISGQGTVDIEPDQAQYEHGTEVNLTAIPDQNWNFVEWTGDYQGTSENITIVMDENKQITAHFSDTVYHTLKISIEGEGSTDPVEGNHTYEEGTDVNITATAAEGWYFQEWTGDIQSTEQNITITMDRDKNITSWFYIYEYDLDISTEGEGSTDPAEGVHSYEHGRKVNITATAAEDWNFVRWKGDNGTVGDTKANTTTITMNDNYSITAKFEVIGGVTYDLTVDSSSGGSVIEPGEGTFTYSENTEVDVQADADQGYEFVEWIGDNGTVGDTEANATTITMDENKSITATFQETVETNTLRLDVEGNGTVKVNGTEVDVPFEEDYEVDTTVELEANASEGWTFTNWTGSVQSDLDSITIIMDEDKNVTAHFEEVPTERHSLSVNIEGNGTVELDGQEVEDGWSQEFDDGVNVTLNAVADEDYTFAGWSGMDKTGQEIEVSIDSDVEITAHFEKAKYELTLSTDGQGSVDRDPERSEYEEGTNVTLTAQPEDGWEFSHWEGDPLEGVVEDDEINITVKDNFNITAYFQEAGGGDDSGEDTADKGEDDSGWLWWLIPLIIVLVIVIALAAWYTQKGDEDEEEEDLSEDLFPEEGTGSTESPPQPSEESMGSEEAPEPEGIGEDEDPFEDEQFEG
ncbi:MAG: hypothetical protein KGY76_02890, partial [Candidatus Thermoplasmatota archaeon]|nr:hypothetical protein [Candidatus Thermoplasmatota archaeon]